MAGPSLAENLWSRMTRAVRSNGCSKGWTKVCAMLFAGQTCDGCHNGETALLDTFYLISPTENAPPRSDGTAPLSSFVTQVEISRRMSFIQTRLACPPGTACAMGAEVAAPPSSPGLRSAAARSLAFDRSYGPHENASRTAIPVSSHFSFTLPTRHRAVVRRVVAQATSEA